MSLFSLEVPFPNGLLGVVQGWSSLFSFAPFFVDVGTQAFLDAKVRTWTCLGTRLGTWACLGQVFNLVASASLVRVPLQITTCLEQRACTKLKGITIDMYVTEDDLCWEALLKVSLASSKAREGASLGTLDLAGCLSLLHMLCFKSLTTFLVNGLWA